MTEYTTIRKFLPKDKERVRQICRDTCHDENMLKENTYLCTKYADYYTESEPEHVFIIADKNDDAQGYILCCPDFRRYLSAWRSKYIFSIRKCPLTYRLLQLHSMWETGHMGKKGFPAHLHIDIEPDFQHGGNGTALMDMLLSHLKDEGISGIYLGCGLDNNIGNSFYRHYGFNLYKKDTEVKSIYFFE